MIKLGQRVIIYWHDHDTSCPNCTNMIRQRSIPQTWIVCGNCNMAFKKLKNLPGDREMEYVRTK